MEIIIFVAVVVVAALLWSGYVKTKKTESDQTIDNWQPPKQAVSTEKEWPFGEKLSEGKIHVKVSDVSGSEDPVETPAPTAADATAENKAKAVAKAKRAPAKASEVKKAPAKAPRKPKTV
jgi:FtsZ-interacting cell division protein ZipA